MNNQPIVIERVFNAPAAKVWRALTNQDEMKHWYFDLAEFKAEVGFQFEFLGGPAPDRQYRHKCQITEVVPGQKLSYSWHYQGYAGNSLVTFELFPQANQTLLRLTHSGLESFPQENADFARENFLAGWHHIIHTSLRGYLELTSPSA